MKIGRISIKVIAIMTILCLVGCNSNTSSKTVGSIAYNVCSDENLVYVKEGNVYTPFIVVTNNYSKGDTLLLRKEVMEESLRMNEYSSYYNNSEIDNFLNNEYYETLGEIQSKINSTTISITTDDSIGISGSNTESIERYVFLLSSKELCFDMGDEGVELKYFKDPENRIGHLHNSPSGWILRTPNTYYLSGVCSVGASGKLGTINSYDKSGIRPAFCVDSSTRIIMKEGVINEKEVYVLE